MVHDCCYVWVYISHRHKNSPWLNTRFKALEQMKLTDYLLPPASPRFRCFYHRNFIIYSTCRSMFDIHWRSISRAARRFLPSFKVQFCDKRQKSIFRTCTYESITVNQARLVNLSQGSAGDWHKLIRLKRGESLDDEPIVVTIGHCVATVNHPQGLNCVHHEVRLSLFVICSYSLINFLKNKKGCLSTLLLLCFLILPPFSSQQP